MDKHLRIACEFRAQGDSPEAVDLLIYDVIGENWDGSGVSAKSVAEHLKEHTQAKQINVSLNSAGGQVFDALAIYNTLTQHPARVMVSIDGAALSAASLIAMAGDEIVMAQNAMLMIHDPHGIVVGGAGDMRKIAGQLDKAKETLVTTYAARTNQTRDDIATMMAQETWFSAEEAIAAGFADRVIEAKRITAHIDLSQFRNAPRWVGQLIDQTTTQAGVQAMPEPEKTEEEKKKEEEAKAQEEEEKKKEEEEAKAQEEEEKKKEEAKAQEEKKKEEEASAQAASVTDLRAALPGASSDFILVAFEQKLTLRQAVEMSKATVKAMKPPGGSGLPDGKSDKKAMASGDFVADAKVYKVEHKCTLREAMSALAKDNPEAHAAWVDSQKPHKT